MKKCNICFLLLFFSFILQSCNNDVEKNIEKQQTKIVEFDANDMKSSVNNLYQVFNPYCELEGLKIIQKDTLMTRNVPKSDIYEFSTVGNKPFLCISEQIDENLYKTTIKINDIEIPYYIRFTETENGLSFEYIKFPESRNGVMDDLSARADRWMPCMENAMSSHIGVIIAVSGVFGLSPIAAGLTGVMALGCFG